MFINTCVTGRIELYYTKTIFWPVKCKVRKYVPLEIKDQHCRTKRCIAWLGQNELSTPGIDYPLVNTFGSLGGPKG